ncbi:MAG: MlaD family protein [Limisphaerales bacterium]
MSAKANHFKLGLFVLAGFGTLLAALLLLGMGRSLKKPLMVETYLDQSVQGLEVGSKVNFRGVHFGTVATIGFSRARYEEGKAVEDQRRYILIEVAVESEFHKEYNREELRTFVKAEVLRGLRFRLNSQGITGLSYLELDYVDPARFPTLPVTWTPEHLYVPSAPGTLTKLLSSAEQVFRKLENVDLAQVLTNLNNLLTTTEREIGSARIADISAQATDLLSELRESNRELQAVLKDPKLKEIPLHAAEALRALRGRLERLDIEGIVTKAERVLATADGFLAGKEPELAATLANLKALSENLRILGEAARNHPSGLLLGLPPKPVQ